jgi:hypothetical protein
LTLLEIQDYVSFSDGKDVLGYGKEAIEALYKAGIISGKPGNWVASKDPAIGDEATAMLRRFLGAVSG